MLKEENTRKEVLVKIKIKIYCNIIPIKLYILY